MFFPEKIEKEKNDFKNGDELIQHIPPQIAFMKLDRNTMYKENKEMKIIPDIRVKDSLVNPTKALQITQATTQPVVLLCVNMVQNREVIIISLGNTIKFNENTYPKLSPESNLNIYQLLQSIKYMCRSNKQRFPQQAITQGNSPSTQNSCHKSPKIFELSTTPASISEKRVPAHSNVAGTKHTNNTYLAASQNLSTPISSEYQMIKCFHIYNKIFTEFLKTFAVMYCTLTNKFLTKHKNMPCLCPHYWYFRNFTQGYVLKCVLKNGKINALNVMRNLYFIIISKSTSSTKIDIFFEFQDGVITVYNDNQECRFTQHILLNKESIKEMDSMSSLHTRNTNGLSHVSNCELVHVQCDSDENSDLSVSSSLFLPEYPSQITLFEEEINTWYQCIKETEKEKRNKNESFEYPDPKHDLNEIYVNVWCSLQEITESLRNFSHSTHAMVYNQFCCTVSVLGGFDIFNEELFAITSFDRFLKHSSKHFSWKNIYKPLLHTLAYTMFSSVL